METVQHTSGNKPLKTVDESLSLRDILDIFLINWKWFLLSAIVCVGLARLYLATKPRIYQRLAVMLVKEDGGMGGRRVGVSTDALMQLNGVMAGTSVKNEVYILQSNQLMQEVVRTLKLDVSYSCKKGLRQVSLYDKKPVSVEFLDCYSEPLSFVLKMLDSKTAHIMKMTVGEETLDYNKDVKIGKELNLPCGRVCLKAEPEYLEDFKDVKIIVSRTSVETATNYYRSRIGAGEVDKESSLVRLVCMDTNVQRADDILATMLEVYKQSIIDEKNQIARSTANFIDSRILVINEDLDSVETRLASFKQQNKLMDLKQNAITYLEQGRTARERSIQLESQLEVAEALLDFLRSNSNEEELIPVIMGIGDMSIQSQIGKYNELMLQRNRLLGNTGATAPVILDMDQSLRQMRVSILSAMTGYKASLQTQLRQAQHVENSTIGSITSMPEKEKMAQDIVRQQVIKETLYTYLLNKREETALQLAITEANIRIVEKPYGVLEPISPRSRLILMVAFVFGLALPFGYFRIKAMLNMAVRGRKDVEMYTSIPVLGEIPRITGSVVGNKGIIVSEQSNNPVTEAFRLLRFSLDFIKKQDGLVVMFTSTIPGEGKTFVSRNFAVTLAMTGKRIILVDTDIRKRTQSKILGEGANKEGLTSYLSGSQTNLRNLIEAKHIDGNVDFLPAGLMPPNPAELLMSDKFDSCIEELRAMYDYVIIDNVPAQVVADAGIVNRVADITLYVIRVGGIDRRYLPELERLNQEGKFHDLHIVLNDVTAEQKRYGYGYVYKEKKKGLFCKLSHGNRR